MPVSPLGTGHPCSPQKCTAPPLDQTLKRRPVAPGGGPAALPPSLRVHRVSEEASRSWPSWPGPDSNSQGPTGCHPCLCPLPHPWAQDPCRRRFRECGPHTLVHWPSAARPQASAPSMRQWPAVSSLFIHTLIGSASLRSLSWPHARSLPGGGGLPARWPCQTLGSGSSVISFLQLWSRGPPGGPHPGDPVTTHSPRWLSWHGGSDREARG